MLLRLIRRSLAPYRVLILGLIAAQALSVAALLYLPGLNADVVDKGVVKADIARIWRTGGWMLLISLGQVVAAIAGAWLSARIAMSAGRDLRASVFSAVQRFSSREVASFGAPSLITRCTNDVQQVQQLLSMGCSLLVMAPIMMFGGVIMALYQEPHLAWLMAVAVPVLGLAIALIVVRMVPGYRAVQHRLDVVNRVMREHLSGIRVVRAFVREEHELKRFGKANRELADASLRVGSLMALMFPTVFLVMNVTTVAIWWFGGHSVGSGQMQIGALSAYMSYVMQILMAVMMATFMLVMIPRASVAAERIGAVLSTESSVVPSRDPRQPTGGTLRGVVDLKGATMQYPGAATPVLCDIDLHAEPGQTVAIIGSTGAGKTTLLSLIARLMDTTGGSVEIDEIDVRELDPELLWGHIGLVPQQAYLFSGSVASNVRYGKPDASDAQVWRALEIAQARGFVEAMDGGLDAAIEQGGANISGGQRQRLCVARALVAQPTIYLFDDSFSALDLSTDRALRAALKSVIQDSTVFIVAQRVSTITEADRIIVLEDGRVVGSGTHEELLNDCVPYQEIVTSQLGEGAA